MKIKTISLAILAAGAATQAMASGFALSEQSVSAMGTANAGRASNAQDASVVYNNPAAMVYFKEAQFTQALAFIDAQTDIRNAAGGLPGTNYGNPVPPTFVPSGYVMSGDKGGWAWGIGAYGSYGLKTNYEPTYAGRIGGDKSSLTVVTVQPVISFKVTDKVSLAVGPTLNRLDAVLTNATGPATTGELRGRDFGYGYNAAAYFRLSEQTQAGIVYRSYVRYKISDGRFDVYTAAGTSLLGGAQKASTAATLPESVEMAISHKLSDRNTLHAGASWTRWSRLKSLDVTSVIPVPSTPFLWKNTMAYSVGLTHQCNDKLQLRAGLAFDNSPVNPATRSPRVPSADRIIPSVGFGYRFNPTQSVDFSYNYVKEQKANVSAGGLPYTADFYNHANVFGLQFNQKF